MERLKKLLPLRAQSSQRKNKNSVFQILKDPQLDTFPFKKLALESFPCILKRK